MTTPILYVVVPCYNEEAVLPETTRQLVDKMEILLAAGRINTKSRILYVDDGSKDNTWVMIEALNQENELISGLKLSRNKGHQNALYAGLMHAKDHCDCSISIDADLQDDVSVLDSFLEGYEQGCDIVYGVRNDRTTDTTFKKTSADLFYFLMDKMGVESVRNHADCRLMSKRALELFAQYGEQNLYLRGIVPQLGLSQGVVTYKRAKRFAGESKYSMSKMLALAINGITSFSIGPIRLIFGLGVGISILCVLSYFIYVIRLAAGDPGLTSPLITTIWFVCGILLVAIGTVGEYVGKMYFEVKNRPRYFVETVLDQEEDDKK